MPEPEPIPNLFVRLAAHDDFSQYIALLSHGLRYTVLPLPAAFEIPGLVPADLEPVQDAAYGFGLLWDYHRQPIFVFGDDPLRCLRIRCRVAFDSSGRLATALLGQDFYRQVSLHLDPDGWNVATARSRNR